MKRFMFALGLLATVAVSESEAGYIIIRIVLEGGTSSGSTTPDGSGSPNLGNQGNFGSLKGGPGPGGPPPGLGTGSVAGSLGGPPGKGSGAGSLGGPPIAGSGSGPSPMGPGSGPGVSGPGGSTTAGVLKHDPTRSIYVVVPFTNDLTKDGSFYKKAPPGSHNPHWRPAIKHPFGYANLLFDNTQIQLYLDLGPQATKGLKTRQTELFDKHAKWLRAPTDAQIMLDVMTEALEQGAVAEALKCADELAAAVGDKKARTTPQVDRFLTAYSQIKEGITRPARQASKGPEWKERLGFAYAGVREYVSPHYYLLYWEGMDPEAMRRSAQLEENFKAFYLLNAIRGVAMPVPESPLVAILAKSSGDVRKLSASLDGMPLVADGFYSPDHGIVVLSPERLDGVSQTFNRQIQEMFRQGATRKQLLDGEGPKIDANGTVKDSKKPEDVARMMTWVVAERYAEEEGEWSAVSREGTRQLMHAIGLLPQHVSLPHWLAEGSAGYYQRPKGPVFTKKEDDQDYITVALSTGFGGPNYVRQKQFSELIRLNQFKPSDKPKADPGDIVRNVVTDAYFGAALGGLDADDAKLPLPQASKKAPGPGVGPPPITPVEEPQAIKRRRHEFLNAKALATSWSLYYYLAKVNPAGLDRYLGELSKLPRDLPLDESSRLTAFAKAFNLSLGAKRTDDRPTFAEVGAAWLQYMDTVPPAGIEVPLADLAAPTGGAGGGLGSGLGGAPPGPLSGPKPGM